MAPLSPSNTPRFRVKYTNAGHQHSLELRSHLSPAAIGAVVDGLFTNMSPLLLATSIDVVEFAASGSNVFNPVETGIEGNTYGSGAGVAGSAAGFTSFIGRSTDGRRTRVYLYGTTSSAGDWRFVAGENVNIDATVDFLQTEGTNLRTISDLTPIWKSYANAGFSAYWQKRLRP